MFEIPLFKEALILAICCKPAWLRWTPLFINWTICTNKLKSAAFWVNSG